MADAIQNVLPGDTCVLPGDETIAAMTEFFVYKSRADFESWATDGASDANVDRMIHVMLGAKSTTFVTDGPGSSTYKLAAALVPSMRGHRLVAALEAIRARMRDQRRRTLRRRSASTTSKLKRATHTYHLRQTRPDVSRRPPRHARHRPRHQRVPLPTRGFDQLEPRTAIQCARRGSGRVGEQGHADSSGAGIVSAVHSISLREMTRRG